MYIGREGLLPSLFLGSTSKVVHVCGYIFPTNKVAFGHWAEENGDGFIGPVKKTYRGFRRHRRKQAEDIYVEGGARRVVFS